MDGHDEPTMPLHIWHQGDTGFFVVLMQAACLSTLICEPWVAPKLPALLCILTIYLQAESR